MSHLILQSVIYKIKRDYIKANKDKRVLLISTVYRLGSYVKYSEINFILKKLILLILMIIRKIFIEYALHTELPFSAKIGDGLRLVHPYNVIINPSAIIGNNCTIFHEVTIGTNEFSSEPRIAPIIGDNVYIGCGVRIIGPLTIGDNVRIGANAVVTKNIPSNCTVVEYNKIILHKKNGS